MSYTRKGKVYIQERAGYTTTYPSTLYGSASQEMLLSTMLERITTTAPYNHGYTRDSKSNHQYNDYKDIVTAAYLSEYNCYIPYLHSAKKPTPG